MSNKRTAYGNRLKKIILFAVAFFALIAMAFAGAGRGNPPVFAVDQTVTILEAYRDGATFVLPHDTDGYVAYDGAYYTLTDDFLAFIEYGDLNVTTAEAEEIRIADLKLNGASILSGMTEVGEFTLDEGDYEMTLSPKLFASGDQLLSTNITFTVEKQILGLTSEVNYCGSFIEASGSYYNLTERAWAKLDFGYLTTVASDRTSVLFTAEYKTDEISPYVAATEIKDCGFYRLSAEEQTLANNQTVAEVVLSFRIIPYVINSEAVQEIDGSYFNCTVSREYVEGDAGAYNIVGQNRQSPTIKNPVIIFGETLTVNVQSAYYYDEVDVQTYEVGSNYTIKISCLVSKSNNVETSNFAPFEVEIYDASITGIAIAYSALSPTIRTAIESANSPNRTKVYDGTAQMTGTLPGGTYSYENLTLTGVNAEFKEASAGTTEYYLTPIFTGEGADKYIFQKGTFTNGSISPYTFTSEEVALSDLSIPTEKVYDRQLALTVTNVSLPSEKIFGTGVNESLNFALTGAFASAGVGNNKTVTVTVKVTPENGNYNDVTFTTSANIVPYDLEANSVSMDDFLTNNGVTVTLSKAYDNTTAMANNYTARSAYITGLGGDSVRVNTLTSAYVDKNSDNGAGSKAYTVTATLNNSNYVFAKTYATGASISKYVLNADPGNPDVAYTDINYTKVKEYDGSAKVYHNGGELSLNKTVSLNGENLSFTVEGEYGTGSWTSAITPASALNVKFTLSAGSNYTQLTLFDTSSTDLEIVKKALKIDDILSAFNVETDKIYDKTANVVYEAPSSGFTVTLVSGLTETLSMTVADFLYENANAGTGKKYTLTGTLTAASSALSNYETAVNCFKNDGIIERRSLNVTAGSVTELSMSEFITPAQKSRAYDCTANISLGLTNNKKSYVTGYGDTVEFTVLAYFGDKNVGTGKNVFVNVSLDGASYTNYSLTHTSGSDFYYIFSELGTGTVTPVQLAFNKTASDIREKVKYSLNSDSVSVALKTYDGTSSVVFINGSYRYDWTFPTGNADVNTSVVLTGVYTQSNVGVGIDFTVTATSPQNYLLDGTEEFIEYDFADEGEIIQVDYISLSSLPADLSVEKQRGYNGTDIVGLTYLNGASLTDFVFTDSAYQVNNFGNVTELAYSLGATSLTAVFVNKNCGLNKNYTLTFGVADPNFKGFKFTASDGRIWQIPIILLTPERDGDNDPPHDFSKIIGEADPTSPYYVSNISGADLNDTAVKTAYENAILSCLFVDSSGNPTINGSIQNVGGEWFYVLERVYTFEDDDIYWSTDRILLSYLQEDIDDLSDTVALSSSITYDYDSVNKRAEVPFERHAEDVGELAFMGGTQLTYRVMSPFLNEVRSTLNYFPMSLTKYVYDDLSEVWMTETELCMVIEKGLLEFDYNEITLALSKKYDGNRTAVSEYYLSIPDEIAANKLTDNIRFFADCYDINIRPEIVYDNRNVGTGKAMSLVLYLEAFCNRSNIKYRHAQAVLNESTNMYETVYPTEDEIDSYVLLYLNYAKSYLSNLALNYSNIIYDSDLDVYTVRMAYTAETIGESSPSLPSGAVQTDGGNMYYTVDADEANELFYRIKSVIYTEEDGYGITGTYWTLFNYDESEENEDRRLSLVSPLTVFTDAELNVFIQEGFYINGAHLIRGGKIELIPAEQLILQPGYSYTDEETGETTVVPPIYQTIPSYYKVTVSSALNYRFWWYDGSSYYEVLRPIVINGNLYRIDTATGRLYEGIDLNNPLLCDIEKGEMTIRIEDDQSVKYGDLDNIAYVVNVNGTELVIDESSSGELGYDQEGNLTGRLNSIPQYFFYLFNSADERISVTSNVGELLPSALLAEGYYYKVSFFDGNGQAHYDAEDFNPDNFDLTLDNGVYKLTLTKGLISVHAPSADVVKKYFGEADDYSMLSFDGCFDDDNVPSVIRFSRVAGELAFDPNVANLGYKDYVFSVDTMTEIVKNQATFLLTDLYDFQYYFDDSLHMEEDIFTGELKYVYTIRNDLDYRIYPVSIKFVDDNPAEGVVNGVKEIVLSDLTVEAYYFDAPDRVYASGFEHRFLYTTELTYIPESENEYWTLLPEGVYAAYLDVLLSFSRASSSDMTADYVSATKNTNGINEGNFVIYILENPIEDKATVVKTALTLYIDIPQLPRTKTFDGTDLTFSVGGDTPDNTEIIVNRILGDQSDRLFADKEYRILKLVLKGISRSIDGVTPPDYFVGRKNIRVVSFIMYDGVNIIAYEGSENEICDFADNTEDYGEIFSETLTLTPPTGLTAEYDNTRYSLSHSAETSFLTEDDALKLPEGAVVNYYAIIDSVNAGERMLGKDLLGENGGNAKIISQAGVDITSNYEITYDSVRFIVKKRKIGIKMTSEAMTLTYSGSLWRAETINSGNTGSGSFYTEDGMTVLSSYAFTAEKINPKTPTESALLENEKISFIMFTSTSSVDNNVAFKSGMRPTMEFISIMNTAEGADKSENYDVDFSGLYIHIIKADLIFDVYQNYTRYNAELSKSSRSSVNTGIVNPLVFRDGLFTKIYDGKLLEIQLFDYMLRADAGLVSSSHYILAGSYVTNDENVSVVNDTASKKPLTNFGVALIINDAEGNSVLSNYEVKVVAKGDDGEDGDPYATIAKRNLVVDLTLSQNHVLDSQRTFEFSNGNISVPITQEMVYGLVPGETMANGFVSTITASAEYTYVSSTKIILIPKSTRINSVKVEKKNALDQVLDSSNNYLPLGDNIVFVSPKALTVAVPVLSFDYNGQKQSISYTRYVVGGLITGHSLSNGSVRTVGIEAGFHPLEIAVPLVINSRRDFTANYCLIKDGVRYYMDAQVTARNFPVDGYTANEIEIKKKEIGLGINAVLRKNYDGERYSYELSNDNVLTGGLVSGQYLHGFMFSLYSGKSTSNPMRFGDGEFAPKITSADGISDYTGNYNITYAKTDNVQIRVRDLTVDIGAEHFKIYDGEIFTIPVTEAMIVPKINAYDGSYDELKGGDYIAPESYVDSHTNKKVGRYELNLIGSTSKNVVIKNAEGVDVTGNYNVILVTRSIDIMKRPISVYIGDDDAYYDSVRGLYVSNFDPYQYNDRPVELSFQYYKLKIDEINNCYELVDGEYIVSGSSSTANGDADEYSLLTMTENKPIKIRNDSTVDLESNYQITYLKNSYNIVKRNILIDVGEGHVHKYDGNAYRVAISNAMVKDGVVGNVTYNELVVEHTLTGLRKTISANAGNNIEFMTETDLKITNKAGRDVTKNYAVSGVAEARLFVHRTATITKKKVTIDIQKGTVSGYQKTYDGTPFAVTVTTDMVVSANIIPAEFVENIGGLVTGHSIRNSIDNFSTMVSVSSNVGEWEVVEGNPVVIIDGSDNDVTDNYVIEFKGYDIVSNTVIGPSSDVRKVSIVKRVLTINPGTVSANNKYYDGNIYDMDLQNSHVQRSSDAGVINNFYIEGRAYSLTPSVHGNKELTVDTNELKIYSLALDGVERVYSCYKVDGDPTSGVFRYVDNYDVRVVQGYCAINRRPVYVYTDLDTTVSKSKVYDNSVFVISVSADMVVEESDRSRLQENQVDIGDAVYMALPEGITVSGTVSTLLKGAQNRVLISNSTADIRLKKNEEDVTLNFTLTVVESYVNITKKTVTVKPSNLTPSAEKVYDGEPWSLSVSDNYAVMVEGLLSGHAVTEGVVVSSDKNVGASKETALSSAVPVKIFEGDIEVTQNYEVTYEDEGFNVAITQKEVYPLAVTDAFIYKSYNGRPEATVLAKHYRFEGVCASDEIRINNYFCNFVKYREGEYGSGELLTVKVYSINNSNYSLRYDKDEAGNYLVDEVGRYATFTIQGSITKKNPTLVLTETERIDDKIAVVYTYDGQVKSVTGRYSLTGLEDAAVSHKVTYYDSENRVISAPTDVGDYTVEFSTYGDGAPLDIDYPNWSTTIMLRIKKADAYMSFLVDENSVYSGNPLDVTVRVSGINLSKELSMTNTVIEDGELISGILCHNDKGEAVSQIIDAGTYTITASFSEGGNYNAILNETRTVTVATKGISVEYGNDEFVYNGYERDLSVTALPNSFCERDAEALAGVAPVVIYSPSKPLNAGLYTAKVHYENKNYHVINDVREFSVKKRELTVAVLLNNASELFISEGDSYTYSIVYNGFVNNESEHVFAKPVYVTELPEKAVTNFIIRPYGAMANNYEFIYVPATLTISEKILEGITEETGTVQIKGTFSAYATLKMEKVEVSKENPVYFEIENKLKENYGETDFFDKYTVSAAYRLSLKGDNVEITQDGMVARIYLEEELRNKKSYMVAHLGNDGTCEMLAGVLDGDYLVFTTDSMGDFAVMTPQEKIATELMVLIYIAPVLIFILGLLLFTLFRKKY